MSDADQDIEVTDGTLEGSGETAMSATERAERLVIRNQRNAIQTHVESSVMANVDKQLKDAFAGFSNTLDAQSERVAKEAALQSQRVAAQAAQQAKQFETSLAKQAETLSLFINAMSGQIPNPSGQVVETLLTTTVAPQSSELTSADVAAADGVTTSKAEGEEQVTYASATTAHEATSASDALASVQPSQPSTSPPPIGGAGEATTDSLQGNPRIIVQHSARADQTVITRAASGSFIRNWNDLRTPVMGIRSH